MEVVKQKYKLRQNFILIGLTGRTGSGCSTVAKVLETEHVQDLKSNYRDFNEGGLSATILAHFSDLISEVRVTPNLQMGIDIIDFS